MDLESIRRNEKHAPRRLARNRPRRIVLHLTALISAYVIPLTILVVAYCLPEKGEVSEAQENAIEITEHDEASNQATRIGLETAEAFSTSEKVQMLLGLPHA